MGVVKTVCGYLINEALKPAVPSDDLFYNENLYYLLCSCTNPTFGKNLVPEIYAKVLSVNHIVRFLNNLFLQNKSVKQHHFLHVDTNSQKLKVVGKYFGWTWSNIGVANLVSALKN